ncbi:MAG: Cd(II)/Pb(II)-responsive transcriptional regulator [Gammaproteobacteria bacterium]|nr:Cd(II)/Pb(II)-responsive transcriptional regulator [Gammaproteobacteria bacterium]
MEIRIGDLAKRSGCEVVTIRYYEKEGLLPKPARSGGNFRLYGDAHIERLQFIRHCRSLDMRLAEIRTLLSLRQMPKQDCTEVNLLLDAHIANIEERINDLTNLRTHLFALRGKCAGMRPTESCGILNGLSRFDCHSQVQNIETETA